MTQATAHQGSRQALNEGVDKGNVMQILAFSYRFMLVGNNS